MAEIGPPLLESLQILSSAHHALCDPMRDSEQPCFITLLPHLVAARPCFDQPKRQQDPEIISLLRTCLSLSMRWICAPRKRSERDALMRRSCRCPASVRSTPAHQSILPDHSWPCMAVISELLEAVEGAYTPALRRMQPHTLRLDRLTSHSPWPQSIGEILPHGAEDTIRGLFSWIDADFGKADALCIVRGLDTILAFTRPLTLPYVVTSRALLSRCIIPLIDQACAAAQLRIVVPPAKPDRAVVLPAQQKLFSILPVALGSIACILANYADEEQRRVLLGLQHSHNRPRPRGGPTIDCASLYHRARHHPLRAPAGARAAQRPTACAGSASSAQCVGGLLRVAIAPPRGAAVRGPHLHCGSRGPRTFQAVWGLQTRNLLLAAMPGPGMATPSRAPSHHLCGAQEPVHGMCRC
jgi:hypothetical protein